MPTYNDATWAESEDAASLLDAFVALPDREAAERFIRDLCTRREVEEMVSRWAVVRGLAGGASYRAIHDNTGVSTATITRINDWFRNGTGGYADSLARLGIKLEKRP